MNDDDLSPDESRARDAVRSMDAPRLDDVTRRRLVRNAMRSVGDRGSDRRTRWAGVAAAAAAVALIVVVGVSLTRSSNEESAQLGEAGSELGSDAPQEDTRLLAAAPDLGIINSLEEVPADALATLDAQSAVAFRLAPGPLPICADALPAGAVVDGYARATYRGEPVVIAVARDTDGLPVVHAITIDDCRLVETLGP